MGVFVKLNKNVKIYQDILTWIQVLINVGNVIQTFAFRAKIPLHFAQNA
jgi:hypothetical protein